MIKGLIEEISEFSNEIKNDFPDYLSIYDYFCKYINENYSNEDLKDFFNHNLCRRDIINSCVYYLEQSNASSVTAIEKYLNAVTKLYNSYLCKRGYNSSGLDAIIPFSSCKSDVKEKVVEKELREKCEFPAISNEEFKVIVNYLKNSIKRTYVGTQISIIFKLILLYGFKFERLKYIQVKDFNGHDNSLYIQIDDSSKLTLTLPGYLAQEIRDYISRFNKDDKEAYLFVNSKGHVLESSFFSHTFVLLHNNYQHATNSFTLTGMAKYAIINMIREGMSSSQIKIITGMEDDIINDCQRSFQFDEMKDMSVLTRNINKKIRAIPTYDDMNICK